MLTYIEFNQYQAELRATADNQLTAAWNVLTMQHCAAMLMGDRERVAELLDMTGAELERRGAKPVSGKLFQRGYTS